MVNLDALRRITFSYMIAIQYYFGGLISQPFIVLSVILLIFRILHWYANVINSTFTCEIVCSLLCKLCSNVMSANCLAVGNSIVTDWLRQWIFCIRLLLEIQLLYILFWQFCMYGTWDYLKMKMTCKEDSSVNNNCGQPNVIGWVVEGGGLQKEWLLSQIWPS